MGVEVKVMQCWRCKAYGHRANDRECPLLLQGNIIIDSERQVNIFMTHHEKVLRQYLPRRLAKIQCVGSLPKNHLGGKKNMRG